MLNEKYKKESLEDLTWEHFHTAAMDTMLSGYTDVGLLGIPTGDDVVLYGFAGTVDGTFKRSNLVSLRNYCGTLEMLITDRNGNFLYYGRIDGMPAEDVIVENYRIFRHLRSLIRQETIPSFWETEITDDMVERYREKLAAASEIMADIVHEPDKK